MLTQTGLGHFAVSPATAVVAAFGRTFTFSYTAVASGLGLVNGELDLTVPTGWSVPSTTGTDPGYVTSACGAVAVDGSTIVVTGVTLVAGAKCSIIYGSKAAAGPGVTVGTVSGANTFSAAETSAARGAATALAVSPSVNVTARPLVTGLDVRSGPTTGGTSVTITGLYFAMGDTVVLGQGTGPSPTAIAGTSVTVNNSMSITFTTGGPAKAGLWHVYVVSPGGVASPKSPPADSFTYVKVKA